MNPSAVSAQDRPSVVDADRCGGLVIESFDSWTDPADVPVLWTFAPHAAA